MTSLTRKIKCCRNWFKAPDFSFKMDNDDIENDLHLKALLTMKRPSASDQTFKGKRQDSGL